jgi:oxygen-independent coproporphyrinogen-3 oxidase
MPARPSLRSIKARHRCGAYPRRMTPSTFPAPDGARRALAESRVPRYTSYPTAAQFGAVEEASYRAWLRDGIGPQDRLSLYLHVPFCRDLCWYCACHTRPTRSDARILRYAAALEAEAALLEQALPPHGGVSHLHFGGGTPTMLGVAGLRRLVPMLRRRFSIRPDAELAIELDPRVLTAEMADTLGALGFTRASLGVQDVAPEVQALIGRPQQAEMVELAMQRLRAAGIAAVNLDLMYGLPGQSVAHVERSAYFGAALGADRVAVFGYAHVPWMRPAQRAIDAVLLPDTAERLAQAEAAEAVLLGAGYEALGLDHFARPDDPMALAARRGALRRNFQGYTTDAAPVLLGLGASAIGSLPGGFAQNEADERRYAEAIAAGRLPVVRGVATTAVDRLRAAMIEAVMCRFAIDPAAPEWRAPAAAAILRAVMPGLEALEAEGLLRRDGARLVVEGAARRFVRQVAACFDAYLSPGARRHSAAV